MYLARYVENIALFSLSVDITRICMPPFTCIRSSLVLSFISDETAMRAKAWHRILSYVIFIFVRQVADAFKWECASHKSISFVESRFCSHSPSLRYIFFFRSTETERKCKCLHNKHDILIRTLLFTFKHSQACSRAHIHKCKLLIFWKCIHHHIANSCAVDTPRI